MVVQRRRALRLPAVEPSEAEVKARAEKLAKISAQRKEDAPRAMAEYRAAEEAVRAKIEKLHAQRLAREASKTVLTGRDHTNENGS